MICFTEDEAFAILWALGHAREAAVANDVAVGRRFPRPAV